MLLQKHAPYHVAGCNPAAHSGAQVYNLKSYVLEKETVSHSNDQVNNLNDYEVGSKSALDGSTLVIKPGEP